MISSQKIDLPIAAKQRSIVAQRGKERIEASIGQGCHLQIFIMKGSLFSIGRDGIDDSFSFLLIFFELGDLLLFEFVFHEPHLVLKVQAEGGIQLDVVGAELGLHLGFVSAHDGDYAG